MTQVRIFKNGLFISLMVLGALLANGQNIGINSTGANPDASAMLDVVATNKGLLLPRVALTALNAASPISSPAVSLLVYNTATAGVGSNQVTPGYYYWSGSAWVTFLPSISSLGGWSTTGNTGTNAATNYVGTADATDLVLRTNAVERARISSTGNVGIGTNLPAAKLDVTGTVKLGASGTVFTNLIRTSVTITDNGTFNFNDTRTVTITVAGANPNATVIVNPRTELPRAIGISWVRVSAANTVVIGFGNSDDSNRSLGTITFDVTVIQ